MSRDELSEMEQLDELAGELVAAGRLARTAGARGERPDPAFAMSLRARLVGRLPLAPATLPAPGASLDGDARAAAVPAVAVPPAAPLDAPDVFVERRHLQGRPFAANRPVWSPEERERRLGRAAEDADPNHGKIVPLRPAMQWRIPTRVAPARWLAAGLVACVAVASLLYGTNALWPVRAPASAEEAVAATLVRDGASSALESGAALRESDEVQVAAGGSATLRLGSSIARLDGGADVRIDQLTADHPIVSQLAGRVYHRVSVPRGGDYRVRTGSVTWQARGTAFDLDRTSRADGSGDEVRALALEHGVRIDGPSLGANLDQGMAAILALGANGAPSASPRIAPIDLAALTDRWLVLNADLDARLGLPLGELASVVTPSPEPTATPAPTGVPSVEPSGEPTDVPTSPATETPTKPPTATPTPAGPTATPRATPRPTPKPTPKPTSKPTPTPNPTPGGTANLGAVSVTRNGDLSYTLRWNAYAGPIDISYYKLVGEPAGTTPDYTKSGNYWAALDPSQTSWTGKIQPGNWWIRVQAVYYPGGTAKAAGQTTILKLSVPIPATVSLGAMAVVSTGGGKYHAEWTKYTGPVEISYYKLAYEPWSSTPDPSYVAGDSYFCAVGTNSCDLTPGVEGFRSGDWALRVQAIYYTTDGAHAAAQTKVFHLKVP